MNSLKSERSNSISEFERTSSSSEAASDDSVRSAQYAEQLNSLATEKMSIAQKKLNKEITQGGIARKMSVCYDESNSFNALKAISSNGSGRQSEHRRSNSIFLARPRKMSHFNDIRKGPNIFNGAAGPASGSDSSIQTFGTP